MNLGGWQILIILLVLILVFGAGKLPTIASSVGQSLKVFKKEVSELRDDTDVNTPPANQNQAEAPRASYDATAPRDERRDEGQDQNRQ